MFATTMFYVVMWMGSLVLLLWIHIYYGEVKWLDFDEDPGRGSFITWLGGFVGVVVAASLVPRIMQTPQGIGAIYVPQPKTMLSAGQPLDLWSLTSDILFNLCIVANSEETMKLAGILTIYKTTNNEVLSVGIPVGAWAILHAYISYIACSGRYREPEACS